MGKKINESMYPITVQADRDDIVSIHMGRTMHIVYDGEVIEYSIIPIRHTIRKKAKKEN